MKDTLRGINFTIQAVFLLLLTLVNIVFWHADTAAVVATGALGLFAVNVVALKAIGLYITVTTLPDRPPTAAVQNISVNAGEDVGA